MDAVKSTAVAAAVGCGFRCPCAQRQALVVLDDTLLNASLTRKSQCRRRHNTLCFLCFFFFSRFASSCSTAVPALASTGRTCTPKCSVTMHTAHALKLQQTFSFDACPSKQIGCCVWRALDNQRDAAPVRDGLQHMQAHEPAGKKTCHHLLLSNLNDSHAGCRFRAVWPIASRSASTHHCCIRQQASGTLDRPVHYRAAELCAHRSCALLLSVIDSAHKRESTCASWHLFSKLITCCSLAMSSTECHIMAHFSRDVSYSRS